ncbi:PALP domain-containing protein [Ideonella paludis]|uniref:hypothetical protein n=1 Tax=Ideonella paludis TaxID=1233411 RepID=UPI003625DAC7
MIDVAEMVVDAPTTWFPLPPTHAQASALARFALHVDDLSLTVRAWRALAKDSALLLPYAAPYPGPLASPLRSLNHHPAQALLPAGLTRAWLKCDDELPLSQSLSDRGMSYAVLSLISDAMIAEGMAHVGQPLMGVDTPGTRTWLSEHQLVIHGPGRDALAAARICQALGLPSRVILQGATPKRCWRPCKTAAPRSASRSRAARWHSSSGKPAASTAAHGGWTPPNLLQRSKAMPAQR